MVIERAILYDVGLWDVRYSITQLKSILYMCFIHGHILNESLLPWQATGPFWHGPLTYHPY